MEKLTRGKKPSSYIFVAFSTANLNKVLKEASKTDIVKLGIVFGIVCVYAWVVQSGLAALGVIVLASSATAALGVCSLIGLPINLLSTHVLPFVSVGLAMREMFLILSSHMRDLSPPEVLQRAGLSIISPALVNSAAFLAAAMVPVPALRVFCLQCAVLVVFHAAALLVVFPALLALEQRCRKTGVPCFRTDAKGKPIINNNNDVVSFYSSLARYGTGPIVSTPRDKCCFLVHVFCNW